MSDANEALYFRDLNRFPTLSPQEEEALLAIIKSEQSEEKKPEKKESVKDKLAKGKEKSEKTKAPKKIKDKDLQEAI